MKTHLVMTIIGSDRPGLVELLATVIARHEGNWLESRMSRLGGHFAGILHVEAPGEQEKSLATALTDLASHGLTVVVHPSGETVEIPAESLACLQIVGQDRPGIVQQISKALSQQGVNVEELNTEYLSAPMSGEALFKAEVMLRVPPSADLASLRQGLEKVAGDLMVDVALEKAVPSELNPK
jgi:glycine cleavage system regulatory protein